MKFSFSRSLAFLFSRFVILAVVATLLISQAAAQVVEIPDPNLEKAILEALNLPDEIPLNQLEMLRLTTLDAADKGITDLNGLEHATFLVVLNLQNNLIGDITSLMHLTQLVHLHLDYNQIHDINPLANLTNLTHLGLSGNQIMDISPLINLNNLIDIRLTGNQITDISPLAGLMHLEELGLNGNQIVDISPLMNLNNLRGMELSANQIRDLGPLAGLIYLEYLGLNRNPIADISPLANLINLKTLFLSGGRLISNITPLANLTQLVHLRLNGQSISDITPLTNLTQLIRLLLDYNQIRDISSLANLTLLEELALNNNAIIDIVPLTELKNLKQLWLADNPIHDFSPLLELKTVELDIEINLNQLDKLNTVVEIPDPNLEQAIRQTLAVPENIPLTQGQMQTLTRLSTWNGGITNLTGLEHAKHLEHLSLRNHQIHDLRPLAGLIHLELLTLSSNQISDISPLVNLTNLKDLDLGQNQIVDITGLANFTKLELLNLSRNRIVDFSPLANLVNLRELFIQQNLGTDISPLWGLNLTEFSYDEICDIPPLLPSVKERIETRSFPSIVQAWDDVVGLDHLTWEQRNVLHDLYFSTGFDYALEWDVTEAEPNAGVAIRMAGNLEYALQVRQRKLDQNPNMIFLRDLEWFSTPTLDTYPIDSDLWLRDTDNQIVVQYGPSYQMDFFNPEFQDLLVKRIVAIANCGLNDGIFFDGFRNQGTGVAAKRVHGKTDEEVIQIWRNIFAQARAQVRSDFLIIVNANRTKLPSYAEFVNGTFMETGKDHPDGYTHGGLKEIESTLLWSEQNLRAPQINCLEGFGVGSEPPDSPNNLRWMRVFTTMSLTHSNGYVLYTTGFRDLGGDGHDHLWHDFWEADLGRPIDPKAQLYRSVDGLFIREFTNGWAVYNRSGKAQTISLPASATAVGNGDLRSATTFLLPDLDGEIYLKVPNLADVNGDGRVNVLDLVQVANGLGKSAPDSNGDGAVNILDLVFVAQQFNE